MTTEDTEAHRGTSECDEFFERFKSLTAEYAEVGAEDAEKIDNIERLMMA